MAWKVKFDRAAERDLDKLDPQIAKRLLAFLHNRIASWTIRAALVKPSKVLR